MTKLAGVVRPGSPYEIFLTDGSSLLVLPAGAKASVTIEKADDVEQVLYLQSLVSSGRHKGEKARTLVPYSAIVKIICA
jgi:hypothetical protein